MNGERYFIYAKVGHSLPQLQKEHISPGFLEYFEQLANRPNGKVRVKRVQQRLAARRAAAAAKAAKQSS